MDIDELRRALVEREGFAPDPDAVLDTVLAHPPTDRVRRHRRRFAAIGIAAAVVLIAGTVGVVRSTTQHVTSLPPVIPSPSTSALVSTLEQNFWSVATVTDPARDIPLSAAATDFFSLTFGPDGIVSLNSPQCQSQRVPWSATQLTVTIGKPAPETNHCTDTGDRPSAAAAPLASAFRAMTAGPTTAHLDGRSLVLQAGASVLVFRASGTMQSAVSTVQQPSIDTAARAWAGFPLDARPRPIVLAGSAVVLPGLALPDGNQENALAAGRISLATTAPAAPATMDGYPVMPADAAIAQFAEPQPITTDRPFLHITKMELVKQSFRTDRGDVSLPTWKVILAETREPIYVLAVAAASRYPHTLTDGAFGEDASLTGDGRDITIYFVEHHASQGGCDRERTSTFASRETSTAVVLAVTTQLHPEIPRPGCTDGYMWVTAGLSPTRGQPDTTTLHLREPLGDRVVVNQLGTPYVIQTW